MANEITFNEDFCKETFPLDVRTVSAVLQEYQSGTFSPFANLLSNVMSPEIPKRQMNFFTPVTGIFRKPVLFNSPHRLVTPHGSKQRLINLSFSQPSTPRTPACTGIHQPTPLSTFDCVLLTTPMLINTLDTLQQQSKQISQSPYPDILQLIDDDSLCGTALEQLIGCREENLTDSNIADYVLEFSQDVKHQTACYRNTVTTPRCPFQEAKCQSQPKTFRRGPRRTKLMTEEERLSLQRIKQEKQKQKRKERFKKPPQNGTRKSKRIRRQVTRYC